MLSVYFLLLPAKIEGEIEETHIPEQTPFLQLHVVCAAGDHDSDH